MSRVDATTIATGMVDLFATRDIAMLICEHDYMDGHRLPAKAHAWVILTATLVAARGAGPCPATGFRIDQNPGHHLVADFVTPVDRLSLAYIGVVELDRPTNARAAGSEIMAPVAFDVPATVVIGPNRNVVARLAVRARLYLRIGHRTPSPLRLGLTGAP